MKIEILGAYGGESPDCSTTCLLINDTIALDAGSFRDLREGAEAGERGLKHVQTDEQREGTLTEKYCDNKF